jgi:hypothetical protein
MRSSCASRPSPAGNMLVKAPLRRHPGRQPRPERVPHRLGELGDPEVQELQLSIEARAHRGGEAASRLRRLAARVPQESSRGVGLRHGVQLGQGPAPRPGVAGPAALDFRKLVGAGRRPRRARVRNGSAAARSQPIARCGAARDGWSAASSFLLARAAKEVQRSLAPPRKVVMLEDAGGHFSSPLGSSALGQSFSIRKCVVRTNQRSRHVCS